MAFTAVGLQGGMCGPSLLDLQILTSATFEQISWVVTSRSVGFALGSASFPILSPFFNVQLIMGSMAGLSAACHFIIPYVMNIIWCIFFEGLSGLANGLNDTATLCFIVQLWGKESAVFLHTVYFGYGFGSLIAPLILKPFLLPLNRESSDVTSLALNGNSSDLTNGSSNETLKYSPNDSLLVTPYLIVGFLTVPIAVFYFVLYFLYPKTEDHPSRAQKVVVEINTNDGKDPGAVPEAQVEQNDRKWSRSKIWTFMMAIGVFSCIYCGMEVTFGVYVTAYAVKSSLKLNKQIGALMSSVYWIFYTAGRVLAAFLTALMGPRNLLVSSLVVILISSVILVIAQYIISVNLFWFGLCLIGVGFSSIWGCIFGFMETKFPVNGPIITTNTIFACVGASLFPAVLGALIDIQPDILIYYVFVTAFIILGLIVFAVYILPRIIPDDFEYEYLKSKKISKQYEADERK